MELRKLCDVLMTELTLSHIKECVIEHDMRTHLRIPTNETQLVSNKMFAPGGAEFYGHIPACPSPLIRECPNVELAGRRARPGPRERSNWSTADSTKPSNTLVLHETCAKQNVCPGWSPIIRALAGRPEVNVCNVMFD